MLHYLVSDDRCCCLIGGFLIMAEVCLAFSGLWFMMSYGAQDGGLPKGKKYYILYLACARFGGDTLNSCAVQWQHWPQTHNLRQKRACMSIPQIETYRKKERNNHMTWLYLKTNLFLLGTNYLHGTFSFGWNLLLVAHNKHRSSM